MEKKQKEEEVLGFKDVLFLFFKNEEKILKYKIGPKIIAIRKIMLILSILMMSICIAIFWESVGFM